MFADVNDIAPVPALTLAPKASVPFAPPATKVTPWLLPDVTASFTVNVPFVVVNVTAPSVVCTPTVAPIPPTLNASASVYEKAPVPDIVASSNATLFTPVRTAPSTAVTVRFAAFNVPPV